MTPESFYRRKGAPFGYSDDYDGFHTGKDYEWAGGTTIPAFANGRVVQKGWTNIHGWYASLFIAGMYWHFCHMQAPATAPLGEIRKGDTIGRVGTTGLSTGNHLHLARSTNITPGYGVRTDPVPAVNELLYNTDPAGDNKPIIIPTRKAPPMFSLVQVPDAGLIYVVGADGRREGVQSVAHLEALLRFRESMTETGQNITAIYFGDFVGNRGAIDWYLQRVNGNNAAPPAVEPHKFTDDELTKIGAAIYERIHA